MIYLCPCVPVTKYEWVNLFIYLFFIIITLKHVSNHTVIFKFGILCRNSTKNLDKKQKSTVGVGYKVLLCNVWFRWFAGSLISYGTWCGIQNPLNIKIFFIQLFCEWERGNETKERCLVGWVRVQRFFNTTKSYLESVSGSTALKASWM